MKALCSTVIVITVWCFGMYIGHSAASWAERDRAVKAGVARYTVDPATGITKFEYVKP